MLADRMAACYFDGVAAPTVFELVLSSGERARVSRWDVTGADRSVTVLFGPFPAGGEFEWVALEGDGIEVSRAVLGSTRVPPGGVFEYSRSFSVTEFDG